MAAAGSPDETNTGQPAAVAAAGSTVLLDDELNAAAWLSSGSSSEDSDEHRAEEDTTAELVRNMEAMLARSAVRSTPGVSGAVAGAGSAAGATRNHNEPERNWREEWRCSFQSEDRVRCRRSCVPVVEAQRSRVVKIPGLLDANDIEQIHALARGCMEADPFWDT